MAVINLEAMNFEKEVIKSSIPVIVDFWANWCGPCKMMAPVFKELSDSYTGKLKFAKLNVDEEHATSEEYDIRGIPCLIVMKGGKEVDRIVGFAQKDALKAKIDAILSQI